MNDQFEREPSTRIPDLWQGMPCSCNACNICGFYGRAKRPAPPPKAEKPEPAKPKTPNLFEESKK